MQIDLDPNRYRAEYQRSLALAQQLNGSEMDTDPSEDGVDVRFLRNGSTVRIRAHSGDSPTLVREEYLGPAVPVGPADPGVEPGVDPRNTLAHRTSYRPLGTTLSVEERAGGVDRADHMSFKIHRTLSMGMADGPITILNDFHEICE